MYEKFDMKIKITITNDEMKRNGWWNSGEPDEHDIICGVKHLYLNSYIPSENIEIEVVETLQEQTK